MIYLDYNATTPIDSRVLKAMLPFFQDEFANPSSDHAKGAIAKEAVEMTREATANLIKAKKNEIIFTSGATESNNLALFGLAMRSKGKRNHIITSKIEHPAILNPCSHLESQGFKITQLKVDKYGIIDLEQLEKSITGQTFLISIMYANNEIGTIEPIKQVGEIARKNRVLFHTDAAQAVGHVDINVDENNIDLLSMSAHKFNGPKGIGALFVRNRLPRVRLNPILYGGGQERGFRSGTLNVPAIVGMGEACKLSKKEMKSNDKHFKVLIDKLYTTLKKEIKDIKLNGHPTRRLPHTLNIEIPNVDNKWLTFKMKDFCFSTGSACSDLHDKPSHVLLAIGLDQNRINNCIRIAVGINTTEGDVNKFIQELLSCINSVKNSVLQ